MNRSAWLDELTRPSAEAVRTLSNLEGDVIVLGAGGKMGPSLIKLLQRAFSENAINKSIYAASRFSDPEIEHFCKGHNTTLVKGDLFDEAFLSSLPPVENVFYLVGYKFGASTNQALTWAMNAYLPGRIATHFKSSNVVAFSTGNVYPMVSTLGKGATESTPTDPLGEYAQSCLGRERVFSYFSQKNQTRLLLYRLNYALDLRYGVLNDLAQKIWRDQPIDLNMGYVNVLWQGDANNYAIRCLEYCSSPATILNITGPEKLSIQETSEKLANLMGKKVHFTGKSQPSALLSDSSKAMRLMGKPRISSDQLIEWTARWTMEGGQQLGKPTHFQQRKGKF